MVYWFWRSCVVLVVAAVAGAAAGYLVAWIGEGLAPTTEHRAVVTRSSHRETRDGQDYYDVEVLTEDGRAVDLGTSNIIKIQEGTSAGDPVVLSQSRLTGRFLAVRTVERSFDMHAHAGYLIVTVFPLGAIAAALYAAINAPAKPGGWFLVAAVGLALGAWGLVAVMTLGPEEARTQVPPSALGVNSKTGSLPKRVAQIGEVVQEDGFALQVIGPPSTTPPPGSPEWLRDFRLVVIPAKVAFYGERARDVSDQVELIGGGQGRAKFVQEGPCNPLKPPNAGDSAASTSFRPIQLCFAIPQGFHPRQVVFDVPQPLDTLAVTVVPG